ncbi:hypothetical protein ASPBRDRAFT_408894 [Aspergillus brasiliensis CBS 101740]|uniref:Phosphatidylglycerol/phosphatidylinositol transfer protein n=1 Tax=Aspergillus brasiliensis (strain CBS 101740 / IMI 381727 / IBT 21946) TaxID=767769 RepID=A0A1L9UXG6_ASPBC|nr:hypothetical protein ASPBRDRAFT_408894 [Aspergillus brasiliensis CBS 101740]
MKLLSTAATLLLCVAPFSATARSLDFFNSQTPIKAENQAVEGDNPLVYCNDPSNYILQIERVDLTPNPPLPGKTLIIQATGTLNERIEEGAYVNLEVKYGLITLVKQTADLCEQIVNVDLECPLEKGRMSLTKQVELPRQIPPVRGFLWYTAIDVEINQVIINQQGRYTVHADVYTKDDKHVTCLEAHNIEFKTGFI